MEIARQLVIDHLPQVLLDRAGDRVWERLPTTYTHWLMAKSLAARIVYREGFEYLQSMAPSMIAELALHYLSLELERRKLCQEVDTSALESRQRVSNLLRTAGIFATMGDEAEHFSTNQDEQEHDGKS